MKNLYNASMADDFSKQYKRLNKEQKEAIEMTLKENVEEAGKKLMEITGAQILITRGNEGMTLFEKNEITNFSAKAKNIFDVSGAGDTVLATLTLAWISGASLKEATELSSNAAAIVIEKPGVVAISLDELKSSLICSVKIVPKVWGQEQWLVNNEKYCGKKMLIKDGYYCSYHKHKIKDETFYILDGALEVVKELRKKTEKKNNYGCSQYNNLRS